MSTDNKRELLIAEIPRLRRYAIALLRDRIAADDLVQDVVLRALDRLHLWRDGTNMRTWLFTILHNLHANDMRRLSRATDTQPIDSRRFVATMVATFARRVATPVFSCSNGLLYEITARFSDRR